MLVAGLTAPLQNLVWITDEDDIAANPDRLRRLTDLFAVVSSAYVTHGLGHFRFGTTAIDRSGTFEDFVSIADLTAGALAEYVTLSGGLRGLAQGGLVTPRSDDLIRKAGEILDWFSDNSQPLKRLTYVIDYSDVPDHFRVSGLRFHGSRDLD